MSIRRAFLFSFAERYFNLAFNIVSAMVLARLLTPAEIGLYSVASGLITIAQAVRNFGITTYLIKEREVGRDLIANALGLSLTFGVMLAAGFALFSGSIAQFFAEPRLRDIILVFCVNFLLVPFASVGTALLDRDMNFRAIMMISFASTIVGSGCSMAFAAAGFGALAMAVASVMGIAVGVAGNMILQRGRLLVWPRLDKCRLLLGFGVFSSGTSILHVVAERVPEIVIGRAIGFDAVGYYSRGNGIMTLFHQSLMHSVTVVTRNALAKRNREDGDLRQPLLAALPRITGVAWPLLALLGILAHPAILILFGAQWMESVPVARILCIAGILAIPGSIGFMLFTATGAVRLIFKVQLASVCVHVTGVSAGAMAGLEYVAWGVVGSSALSSLLCLGAVNRELGTHWGQLAAAMARSLGVAVTTAFVPALVVFGLGLEGGDLWPHTLLAGFGGAASWLASLYLFRHPLRGEVALLWGRIRRKPATTP